MNDIIVHSIPGSPYGRAVLIALEEKKARYRFAAVAPGTLRTPEHLARHPFGLIPVVEIGDFRLDNVRERFAQTGDLWAPLLAKTKRVDLAPFL